MKKLLVCSLAMIMSMTLFSADVTEEHGEDYKMVYNAVLDYVEGVYNVQPERIKRSVHPDLKKLGYYWDKKGKWHPIPMNFEELVKLTANWNKDGSKANADSKKIITIFEVKQKTASAKVEAVWGQDYIQLAKLDGKWMIMHVLWQSIPE